MSENKNDSIFCNTPEFKEKALSLFESAIQCIMNSGPEFYLERPPDIKEQDFAAAVSAYLQAVEQKKFTGTFQHIPQNKLALFGVCISLAAHGFERAGIDWNSSYDLFENVLLFKLRVLYHEELYPKERDYTAIFEGWKKQFLELGKEYKNFINSEIPADLKISIEEQHLMAAIHAKFSDIEDLKNNVKNINLYDPNLSRILRGEIMDCKYATAILFAAGYRYLILAGLGSKKRKLSGLLTTHTIRPDPKNGPNLKKYISEIEAHRKQCENKATQYQETAQPAMKEFISELEKKNYGPMMNWPPAIQA